MSIQGKLLSEDPANYQDAPTEGIRRILEEVTGAPFPRQQPLDTSRIGSIRMGTTVRSQNAPLHQHRQHTHGHNSTLSECPLTPAQMSPYTRTTPAERAVVFSWCARRRPVLAAGVQRRVA
jgi:hypothetical protein